MANITAEQLKAKAQQKRDEFMKNRTIISTTLKTFSESIKGLDEKFLKEIGVEPEDLTAEKLLPSMFAEKFDKAVYMEERDAALNILGKFATLRDDLIRDALKELGVD